MVEECSAGVKTGSRKNDGMRLLPQATGNGKYHEYSPHRHDEIAMSLFSAPDLIALFVFLLTWFGYATVIERTSYGRKALNSRINDYRGEWMRQALGRDVRIIDGNIAASLQNGTAFFASTSLLAIGGSVALLGSGDEMIHLIDNINLPLGMESSRVQWEIKSIGLTVIFIYAFFKFAWCYRLYNYLVIMIGAMPPSSKKNDPKAKAYVRRASKVCYSAGRSFNRGQRAFFFALGYLGWFVTPWLLLVTTAAVVAVMWLRQFNSDAYAAITDV
jgi:uncharacterized membrane protein